ncbi:tetratricopeptide repeat protein [Raoultella planticola]|uniref:tetratricopeptide repeat protein n=1 Tax=Raoultella planticola TaxID=575 RepID=UPI001033DF24|nr:tetratricopeptide repeat protein [Raoultella planticola]
MSYITLFETVGKFAGIGGIAILAAMYVFKDVIKRIAMDRIGAQNTYKLARLLLCLFTFISITGIAAWVLSIWLGMQPNMADEIEKARSDEYFISANNSFVKTNDFTKVFELYKKSANENNNIISLGHIASMYFSGTGVESNEQMAKESAEKSAQKLNDWCNFSKQAEPCFALALLLIDGIYINKDEVRAFDLAKMAADKGYVRAYYFVGNRYYNGIGTKRNETEGINWITKAAVAGNVNAMERIYFLSKNKKSFNYNPDMALSWLVKSAKLGQSDAQYQLGIQFIEGDLVKKNNTQGIQWIMKSIRNKNTDAMVYLSDIYYRKNEILPHDIELAIKYLKLAADLGSADAFDYLGVIYENEIKDYKQAVYFFSHSVEKGNTNAMNNLAKMYYKGRGVSTDYKKSKELLISSAKLNNSDAQATLAECYYIPCSGYSQDYNESLKWGLKASNNNDTSVYYTIGAIYAKKEDKFNTIKWLDKSIQENQPYGWLTYASLYELNSDSKSNIVTPNNDKALYYYSQAFKAAPKDIIIANAYWFFRAKAMLDENQKKLAFDELKKLSNSNDSCVQFSIATIYKVNKNMNEAAEWYRKSAMNGNSCAQIEYAKMLLIGDVIQQDTVSAFNWLSKADSDGDPIASYNLGILYIEGKYTTKDISKGIKYLDKSARNNNTKAMIYLSSLYSSGISVDIDLPKSLNYFNSAVKLGDLEAMNQMKRQFEMLTCSGNSNNPPTFIAKSSSKM